MQSCEASKNVRPDGLPARNCLDLLRNGVITSGQYKIYDCASDCFINVYCDMESEPGAAWTLVESFAFKNRLTTALRDFHLSVSSPINERTPNFNIYRMSLSQMTSLKSQSSHWRVTCSLPTHGVDYRDYARAKFADFDIMTFTGSGVCKKMEYVNIRDHQCAQCTAMWWHINAHPAMDSSISSCEFVPTSGSVPSEDNFGYYAFFNTNFRCSAGPDSTTSWWFGGYL